MRTNTRYLWAGAVVAMALATNAWAVEPSPPVLAGTTDAGALEEIIVTAQKRSEDMQRVPVAITAFTAKDLEAKGISTLNDLKFQVPGLQVYDESPGITNYTIRGLGNENNRSATSDGSVGVFLNEVYIGRPFLANTDFLDVDRVEVLRGPQGTLFGRNTIGGAISFFSAQPDAETHAAGEVTYGNYNAVDAAGYVSGQIADNLYGKIAMTSRSHDGYDYNTTTNTAIEDEHFAGLSGALRYKPTDNLDITLNLDLSRRRGTGDWWIVYDRGPYSGAPYADPRRGNAAPDNGFGNINNTGGSLNIKYALAFATLTSITSYRQGALDSRSPTVGTEPEVPGPPDPNSALSNILFTQEDDYNTRQYSEELRLTSNQDSSLKWIGGAYFYHENSTHLELIDFLFNNYYGYSGTARYDSTGSTDSYALFGNVSYSLTDAFKITAGARGTDDRKSSTEVPSGTSYTSGFTVDGVQVTTFNAAASKSFSAVTPSLTASYQLTPTAFTYATASKGFKSGGFNDTVDEKLAAEHPFNPEYVWNYETGVKTEWFARRLRLNIAAFYLDYSNLQVAEVTPATSGGPPIIVTGNAGKTHNAGIETEVDFIPVAAFELYGNYSYQKSRVQQLVVEGVNYAGNQLPLVPENKALIGGSYTIPVSATDVTVRSSYSYTSSYFGYIDNNPLEHLPSQSSIDASVLVAPRGAHWNVEMWGKNLDNNLNIQQLYAIFGASYAKLGVPRTYGVTFHAKY